MREPAFLIRPSQSCRAHGKAEFGLQNANAHLQPAVLGMPVWFVPQLAVHAFGFPRGARLRLLGVPALTAWSGR